jgi:hypothetical protein
MKFKGTILYHDYRTGESWTDTEFCYATSKDNADAIFKDRIKYGVSTELVGVDQVKE